MSSTHRILRAALATLAIAPAAQAGKVVATFLLDDPGGPPPGAGALFGLAVTPNANGVYYVDDAANALNLFH